MSKHSGRCRSPAGFSARVLCWLLFFAIIVVLSPTSAVCLEIQIDFHDSFDEWPEAKRGLEDAATVWESVLLDPVTVTIDAAVLSVTELGIAVGGTSYTSYIPRYSDVRQALIDDVRSIDDEIAVAHLPPDPKLIFRTSDPQGNIIVNHGNDAINAYLDVPRANAKALGLPVEDASHVVDAEIELNGLFLDGDWYDFDRTDGISGTDFVGAMLHEIAHALGFMSGVTVLDYYTLPHGPGGPDNLNEYAVWNVLDLYRYSEASLPNLDLALGGEPYFSIDGGASSLSRFSTGQFNGDGEQPSHWIGGTGLMDPVAKIDEFMTLSPIDLRVLDVIGWDVEILAGDFNLDGTLDTSDIDLLVGEIVNETHNAEFDLTDDNMVDSTDVTTWLSESASQNGFAAPYLLGDANLDGSVNASDLNALGQNWLGHPNTWQLGDFTADGTVDANDLNQLAQNWLASIPAAASPESVSEPSGMSLLCVAAFLAALMRLKSSSAEHLGN